MNWNKTTIKPQDGETILCTFLHDYPHYFIGEYRKEYNVVFPTDGGGAVIDGEEFCFDYFDYWMPVPEYPTK